jgi:hypothetical protein
MTYPGIELDILNHRQGAASHQCHKILKNLHINFENLGSRLPSLEIHEYLGDKHR